MNKDSFCHRFLLLSHVVLGIQDFISDMQFHDVFLLCLCFKIFEQFVKTRIKEEYKEKKSKLLLAKEEFKKLLEESKVSPRYGEINIPDDFWGWELANYKRTLQVCFC